MVRKVAKVILLKDGKVLLQHRDNNPKLVNPNLWSLFGGHIEEGEQPKETLTREIKEELGATLKNIKFLCTKMNNQKDGLVQHYIYTGEFLENYSDLVLTEGQGMGLFNESEVKDIELVPLYEKEIKKELRKVPV